ncbi:hypothetical protein RND71_003448 [Anisodus tanguticus]|uniref:Uncharacterized protein n=1 Tax=Anisodus tanguticus TaxID=243964 RepID=A0AAE1VPZ8_9SOLA|nr:hypothetical protein RND71_003448 [Anisodus tanguticus]
MTLPPLFEPPLGTDSLDIMIASMKSLTTLNLLKERFFLELATTAQRATYFRYGGCGQGGRRRGRLGDGANTFRAFNPTQAEETYSRVVLSVNPAPIDYN